MSSPNYHCESQQRVLKVLMGLFGHEILGVSPSQLASGLGIKPGSRWLGRAPARQRPRPHQPPPWQQGPGHSGRF
jgi:hypothetical protein